MTTAVEEPVLACHNWKTNADLIADVARLGFIKPTDLVLDPTYGRGTWWKKFRPARLIAFNRKVDGSDFRDLPMEDDSVDVAAYDPPYVAKGGRKTSGIKEKDSRYGQDDCPPTPELLQDLINGGLDEMARIVKPKGYILVKCQNYVSSGKLWPGVFETIFYARALGFLRPYKLVLVDQFEMVKAPGVQPPRTRKDGKPVVQKHARHNNSTLLIFQKIKD